MKKLYLALAVLISSVLVFPYAALAAGFEISPARFEKTVMPGDVVDAHLKIINKGSAVTVVFSVADFTFKDDSGTPLILGDEAELTRYSLAKWLKLPDDIKMTAGGEQEVQYKIHVPEDASPGSHYGTIFVQQKVEEVEDGLVPTVTKVGALIFLKVKGPVEEKAMIESFTATGSKNAITFQTSIINDGNVHIVPKGEIIITDSEGRTVERLDSKSVVNDKGIVTGVADVDYIIFNKGKYVVLPEQTRKIETSFISENVPAGEYHAHLKMIYGENDNILESDEISFVTGNEIISASDSVVKKVSVKARVAGEQKDKILIYIAGGGILFIIAIGALVLKNKKK